MLNSLAGILSNNKQHPTFFDTILGEESHFLQQYFAVITMAYLAYVSVEILKKGNKKVERMKDPAKDVSYCTLTVYVIRAVQVALIVNVVLLSFRIVLILAGE